MTLSSNFFSFSSLRCTIHVIVHTAFKHTWLFAVSIERVKMAPELVVFLWVLRRRRTELARRVVL